MSLAAAPSSDEKEKRKPIHEIGIAPVFLRDYDRAVRPHRVVAYPRYKLRFLPFVGPEILWIDLAFKQSAYERGIDELRPGTILQVPVRSISRWSGLRHDRVWRHINKPELGYFIKPLALSGNKRRWEWDTEKGQYRGVANEYQVVMSIPLTPVDAASLKAYLQEKTAEGMPPFEILQAAIRLAQNNRETLLPRPESIVKGDTIIPKSAESIVFEVLGNVVDSDMMPALKEMSSALHDAITRPNSVILIRHYFVEKWLPRLGPAMGWFVVLCRGECFYQKTEQGEILKATPLFKGGYKEIADRLGISRPKTIGDWISGRGSKATKWLPKFVKEIEHRKLANNAVARRFKVAFIREPVTPEDRNHLGWPVNPTIDDLNSTEKSSPTVGGIPTTTGTPAGVDPSTLSRPAGENPTTPAGGNPTTNGYTVGGNPTPCLGDSPITQREISRRQPDSLKDSLSKSSYTEKSSISTSTTSTKEEMPGDPSAGDEVVVQTWKFDTIPVWHAVDPKIRSHLLKKGSSAEVFVSWLLYAAGPRGANLKDVSGVSLAISRLAENPSGWAGPVFKRLAKIAPKELRNMIVQQLRTGQVYSKDWRQAMTGSSLDRLRELGEQLGLSEDEISACEDLAYENEDVEGSTEETESWFDEESLQVKVAPEITAETAWRAAVGQLQMEMPQGVFDSWVRDTQLLGFKDGTFVVGAYNAYARDWLEDRLQSTAKRVLTGIVGSKVEIRFVVWDGVR